MIASPIAALIFPPVDVQIESFYMELGWVGAILLALVGALALFVTLHLARGIGWLHGRIAKQMLVRV